MKDFSGFIDNGPPCPDEAPPPPEAELRLAMLGGELVIAASLATLEALAREINTGGGGYIAFHSRGCAMLTVPKNPAPNPATHRT